MDHRIKVLQKKLTEQGFAAAVIWYSRDLFYYTGTTQPAWLVVFPETYRLFIRSGYAEAVHQTTLDERRLEEEKNPERIGRYLKDHGMSPGAVVGMELDVMPMPLWRRWTEHLAGYALADLTPWILEQRQVKDGDERERIRRACRVMDLGHDRLREVLRAGMTELDAAAVVENAHRRAGSGGIFFMRHPDFFMARGLCASGPNLLRLSGPAFSLSGVGLDAAVPAGPSRRVLEPGDALLIDIPVLVEGYHVDMARTYVIGAAGETRQRLHEHLEDLFAYAGRVFRPGMTWGQGVGAVTARAEALGVGPLFQRMVGGKTLPYIGHGVGIELNEPPLLTARNDAPVLAGTVIALEMHLLRENDFALKMEDMLLIGAEGNAFLTQTPRTLLESP